MKLINKYFSYQNKVEKWKIVLFIKKKKIICLIFFYILANLNLGLIRYAFGITGFEVHLQPKCNNEKWK